MNVYLGTAILTFATLALQITLTRLLSVVAWYHIAFFAIATAMLGMTAGATAVYLKPNRYRADILPENLARACMAYALSVPFVLVVLCMMPLVLTRSVVSFFGLIIATLVCALPFYFAGIAVTLVLTKSPLPIGKLYASDLIGAALGCLFVLAGLEFLDAPSLIIVCGAIGAFAGSLFTWDASTRSLKRRSLALGILLAVAGVLNSTSPLLIRPLLVKGRLDPAAAYMLERWNSFSRVAVTGEFVDKPQYWGPSPTAPQTPITQHAMQIDGAAGTVVRRFRTMDDIEHLQYDVTNIAYYLRRKGGVCVIGVGGGRDLQSAILSGHEHVTGVDVNPIFIDLLQNEFREFAGLADRKDVLLVADEARSYLARSDEQFAVIQMSLIDTWAATGAGAFSLSENSLYTVEAWNTFYQRLTNDGIFTVSRWYSANNLGETGRLLSLASACLLRNGVAEPATHLALVTTDNVSTLLLSRRPFTRGDVEQLQRVCKRLQFDTPVLPFQGAQNPILEKILQAHSLEELASADEGEPLRLDPPTDEDPYFFNMLQLNQLGYVFQSDAGVLRGNLLATLTLLSLIVALVIVSLATVLVPLLAHRMSIGSDVPRDKIFWPAALYFAAIGCGFMLVEIALIQRLSVLLSHPTYALGILLFTIILSAGVGSLLSDRLPLDRSPWVYLYPIVTVAGVLLAYEILVRLAADLMTAPMYVKIVASVGVIFPLGILMGCFFPSGMRLVRVSHAAETPWYWALNGIFGVLCSALAVFLSIFFGNRMNFYAASGCYAVTLLCVHFMRGRSPQTVRSSAPETVKKR